MAEFSTDVVIETTTTTGTGTFSLAGAMAGARTFVAGFSTGSVVRYMARTLTTSKWEIGYGTITAGTPDTLTRNVISSSNTNALVDWQTGDGTIYVHTMTSADDLAKVRGLHRGSSAPTAPLQSSMLWADTTAGVTAVAVKYYDGADWITLFTVNETANTISYGAATFGGAVTFSGAVTMNGKPLYQAKGAAVASASTCDIWTPADGDSLHITGTIGIVSFGTAPQAGASKWVTMDDAVAITHGANLDIPGGANRTTAAGDRLLIYAETTTAMVIRAWIPDAGVVGDLNTVLTAQGDLMVRDASGATRLAAGTAGYALNTAGAAANLSWGNNGIRAHCAFNGTGTPAFRGTPYNVASITDNGTGDYTLVPTTALPSANFTVLLTVGNANSLTVVNVIAANPPTTTAIRISVNAENSGDANVYATDSAYVYFAAIGG